MSELTVVLIIASTALGFVAIGVGLFVVGTPSQESSRRS